jgi:hypothetical protein
MPNQDRLLQFFVHSHLRSDLQVIAGPFSTLAEWICDHLPQNPERTVALRRLLESKDAAVRSVLYRDDF